MLNTVATADVVIRLYVHGFDAMERRLLEGTAKLSQRRPPRIELLAEGEAGRADVLLIDGQDAAAVQWAAAQPWIAAKPAIWAGGRGVRAQHVAIERHVSWPILPVLLYRALEHHGHHVAANVPAPTPAPGRARVLVVDDSLAVRNYLRSLLEQQGADVTDVEDPEAGVAAALGGGYALVLMDVMMPGIDGFEACRRIKAAGRVTASLPVVMLTSKSSPFDRVRGKMAGCDSYLTKPVDPAQLQDVVARHLARRGTPAQPSVPSRGVPLVLPRAA